ncbi:MAG: hypothetical protein J3K34DRAFT_522986 [Monoraphidium minutum]|nr:MAG: hypothetical protein J3K34DRAFT_522986 [Monoraphidium minutum]
MLPTGGARPPRGAAPMAPLPLLMLLLLTCGATPALATTVGSAATYFTLAQSGAQCSGSAALTDTGPGYSVPSQCNAFCKANPPMSSSEIGSGVYFTIYIPFGPPTNRQCKCFFAADCALPSTASDTTATIYRMSECSTCASNQVQTQECSAEADTQCEASAVDDPHLQGFHGHRYSFCDDSAPCMGRAFSLLSAAAYALNARVTRMAGPDRWPWAGAWLTALGFRYACVLTVELELATAVAYAVHPDGRGADTTTADIPRDWAGVFAGVRVNGKDAAAKIGSGETIAFDAASAHFPAARHKGDAADGPVLVLTTPDMQITLYLESEDVTHLDFAVTLFSDDARRLPAGMHGLLGQSLAWAAGNLASIEGVELDYAVEGGLLGTAFKYSRFEGAAAAAAADGAKSARRILGGPRAAPVPAKLVGGSRWDC